VNLRFLLAKKRYICFNRGIDKSSFCMVNDFMIIEIKSIEEFHRVHHKQILTYMKLAGIKLGLLVNFNTDSVDKGIIRKVNGLP
jgi:GxxExxY protein